jgi:hypothetical protein
MSIKGRNVVAMATWGALYYVPIPADDLRNFMMSDFAARFNAIRSKFNTDVTTGLSLPTQFDNDPTEPDKSALWCRFTILPANSKQKSVGAPGANIFRTPGLAIAQLFGPLGQGDGDLLGKADDIIEAFCNTYTSGVHFGTPSIKQLGNDGSFWQVNIAMEFWIDQLG